MHIRKKQIIFTILAIIATYCLGQTHHQLGTYFFDFEDTNIDNYTLGNDPSGFGWYIGDVANNDGTYSLYMKSFPFSGGVSLGRTFSAQFHLHLIEGTTIISFDWKARNISPYGRLFVFLIPYNAGTYSIDGINSNERHIILPNGAIQITGSNGLYSNTSWQTLNQSITIPQTGDYILFFVWFEVLYDSSPDYNSYAWVAAVDNITVLNSESYATSFENGEVFSRWHFENDGSNSNWCIDSSVSCNGSNSLYISNNNGVSNYYINSLSSFAYAYREVYLRAGNWSISYDWKSNGESNGDYMRVLLVSEEQSLSNIGYNLSSLPSNAIVLDGGSALCNQTDWTHYASTFIIPNGGLSLYKLAFYWISNGNGIGNNPPAAIDNLAINYRPYLTVELNNPYHSTSTGYGQYDYMDTALVHIVCDEHYHISRLYGSAMNSPFCHISLKKDTSAFSMDNNYTLYADVAIDTHIVQVNSRLNYGNVSVSDSGLIPYGHTCTIYADTCDTNYHFYIWSNGVSTNPYSFIVTQDTIITAIYLTPNEGHLMYVSAEDSSRGHVEISGQCIYRDLFQEGNVEINAIANYGYHFVQWSDGVTTNPRTIFLSQDTSLTAIFAFNQYNLSLVSNDGSLGAVTGGGTYDYLSDVTISATPAPHSHFVQWSDGSTSNPRVVTLTQDISLVSIFEQDPQYVINVMVNEPSRGSADGGGIFYAGEFTTLTANPNEHYFFSSWSDGVNANPYYLTIIENATYTAIFEPIDYTITLTCNDDYMGSVCGGGQYPYGSTANIGAQPFDGFRFIEWSDGSTCASRSITVMRDLSLQARFGDANTNGIEDILSRPSLNVTGKQIIISGAEGHTISVYDVIGRTVATTKKATNRQELTVPVMGVYMVRIEGYKSIKCVVR